MGKPSIKLLRIVWMDDDLEDYDENIVDDIEHVETNLLDTWRHGTIHEAIFHRKSDDTFWCVCYRTDKDGEYNDFRDDELSDSDVIKVEKVEKIIHEWVGI